MMAKISAQQETFARLFVECGVASEALRRAYPASSRWKESTIWSKASRLIKSPGVEQRIRELQEDARKNSDISKQEILNLCRDIIRGQQVPDHQETTARGKKVVGMSRSWAVERVCKMLGFDQAVEVNLVGLPDERMSDDDIKAEIERLEKLG